MSLMKKGPCNLQHRRVLLLLKTQPVKKDLREDTQPYTVHTGPPIPLMRPVNEELDRMETNGITEKVSEPI